jgi:FAD/FMN-containing dehydrogenase
MISDFISLLGAKRVLTESDLKTRFVHIWKMNEPLVAKCVLLPESTREVSEIMKICYAHDQPVVVHGGLTNLVGSTETDPNEAVISMERMNSIEEVDASGRTMTVQAGVILENIINSADENDLLFPLNFGAKGSAQIGGVISANAGGMRVVRYGMTRNLVLGLETVLADGTIINSLKKIIKDNSAYDIKQNFIGSEGTLGIITKAVLRLHEKPVSRNCAFIGVNGYENVVKLLKHMDQGLAGTLSAFELIWKETFIGMTSPPAEVSPPLPYDYEFYVLVESMGGDFEQDQTRMENLLAGAFDNGIIQDAALAGSSTDIELFFRIREDVHTLVSRMKHDQHFDISLPIADIGKTISETSEKLATIPEVDLIYPFGHVADGNIHFMIGKQNESVELKKKIDNVVYSPLKALGGSVSAEHGIGLHKKDYLKLCRTEEEIALMKSLKSTLDSRNILNRGKVL